MEEGADVRVGSETKHHLLGVGAEELGVTF